MDCSRSVFMRVRLIHKFAYVINGIDLTKHAVGDVVDLTPREAALLVAEGWAERVATVEPADVIPFSTGIESEQSVV